MNFGKLGLKALFIFKFKKVIPNARSFCDIIIYNEIISFDSRVFSGELVNKDK